MVKPAPTPSSAPSMIAGLSAIAGGYDLLLCDVWGVLHNGVAAFPAACEALSRFRAGGGTVLLVSNAPRPGDVVATQIAGYGVPAGTFDAVVSSGDVAHEVLSKRVGARVFHIGPPRDLPTFDGLPLTLVPKEEADLVVCSGLFDNLTETPADYRALLQELLARKLPMICSNPDVVADFGTRLVYCAGAIADLYGSMGGSAFYAGKPYPPIYERALAMAATLRGAPVAKSRVLAVGDSVRTDLGGAATQGIDCLFIADGIHAAELGDDEGFDLAALSALLAHAPTQPVGVLRRLAW